MGGLLTLCSTTPPNGIQNPFIQNEKSLSIKFLGDFE
jgi:hypothetical protein